MKKIAVIIPYFGKMPRYIDLWMESAKSNLDIDFLIFTDIKEMAQFAVNPNIKVYTESFENFVRRFQNNFEFEISIQKPYKLCDFRPAYGLVLKDFLQNYDFWGFGDMDLVWGNLSKYVISELLEKYDRIFDLGHLSLFKNTVKMNTLFLKKIDNPKYLSYKYVFEHDFNFYFDETGSSKYGYGQASVAKDLPNILLYDKRICANISPDRYNFELLDTDKKVDYFEYNNGRVFGRIRNLKEKIEFPYVHFSRRFLKIDDDLNIKKYFIGPDIITSDEQKIISVLNDNAARYQFYKKMIKRHFNQKVSQVRKGAIGYHFNVRKGKINIY